MDGETCTSDEGITYTRAQMLTKYNRGWVHETVTIDGYEIDAPNFTKEWCDEKGFTLIPWDAEKEELTEN
jgi:hypothetical protein